MKKDREVIRQEKAFFECGECGANIFVLGEMSLLHQATKQAEIAKGFKCGCGNRNKMRFKCIDKATVVRHYKLESTQETWVHSKEGYKDDDKML